MNDEILKMAYKYLSDLFHVSESKVWFGDGEDAGPKQIHSNILTDRVVNVFGASIIQSKYIINTWLIKNEMTMLDLDGFWLDEYYGEGPVDANVGYPTYDGRAVFENDPMPMPEPMPEPIQWVDDAIAMAVEEEEPTTTRGYDGDGGGDGRPTEPDVIYRRDEQGNPRIVWDYARNQYSGSDDPNAWE